MRRGRSVGNADKVAVVRCWFEIRKQDLRTLMRASGSLILEHISPISCMIDMNETHLQSLFSFCLNLRQSINFDVDIFGESISRIPGALQRILRSPLLLH